MMRHWLFGLGLTTAALFAVGCGADTAASNAMKGAGDKMKDAGKDMKDAAKDMKDSAKDMAGKAGDAAAKAGDMAKDAAGKAGDAAKELMEKAKKEMAAFAKPIQDALPDMEKKINALTGDKVTAAKAKFAEFKTMLDEFLKNPTEKWAEGKDKLMKAFEELKKLAGM